MGNISVKEKIKRYKVFDEELKRINSEFISPNTHESRECRQVFDYFLITFKKLLQSEEPIFDYYRAHNVVGSVGDGLSVGKSYKEFDVNMCIKLRGDIVTELHQPRTGYVSCKLSIGRNYFNVQPREAATYEKWLDSSGYLSTSLFYAWGQSVIVRILTKMSISPEFQSYSVKFFKSGPALTLHVEHVLGITFDVDVVFAFSFQGILFDGSWMMIPKQLESTNEFAGDRCWRYAFPEKEKRLLQSNYHMKPAIRLIKQIRNTKRLTFLASYYIKTLFLLEIDEHGYDDNFWQESLGYIVVVMLYKLRDALNNGWLSFYFDTDFNVFSSLSTYQMTEAYRHINNTIREIEKYCDRREPHRIRALIVPEEKLLTESDVADDWSHNWCIIL